MIFPLRLVRIGITPLAWPCVELKSAPRWDTRYFEHRLKQSFWFFLHKQMGSNLTLQINLYHLLPPLSKSNLFRYFVLRWHSTVVYTFTDTASFAIFHCQFPSPKMTDNEAGDHDDDNDNYDGGRWCMVSYLLFLCACNRVDRIFVGYPFVIWV